MVRIIRTKRLFTLLYANLLLFKCVINKQINPQQIQILNDKVGNINHSIIKFKINELKEK